MNNLANDGHVHRAMLRRRRRAAGVVLTMAFLMTGAVVAVPANAAASDLDTSFNGTGQVVTPVGGTGEGAKGIALASGDYVVAGTGSDSSGNLLTKVARYHPDGSLDTTFGDAANGAHSGIATLPASLFGGSFFQAEAVAVQPTTGDIVLAGTVSSSSFGEGDMALVRLHPDGTVDSTFAGSGVDRIPVGSAGSASGDAVAVDGSGNIYLGGTAVPSGSDREFVVAATDANGALRSSFGSNGLAFAGLPNDSAALYALALDGSQVVAAGYAHSNALVARFTSSGALDPGFNGGAPLPVSLGGYYSEANAVLVRADHSIVIAGSGVYPTSGGDGECVALAHLTAAGALDSSFGGSGTPRVCAGSNSSASAIAQTADGGAIYVAGGSSDGSQGHFLLAKFDASGAPDTSFGTGGAVTSDPAGASNASWAYALLLDGGKPVVAGEASTGSALAFAVERYVASGGTGGGGGSGPVNTAAPKVTGTIGAGQKLTGTSGSWTGATNYTYVWVVCTNEPTADDLCPNPQTDDGSIANDGPTTATTDSYTIRSSDMGKYLILEVKGANATGYTPARSQVLSLATGDPTNRSKPAISGTVGVGKQLKGTPGTWDGAPTHYNYAWITCSHFPTADNPCPNQQPGDGAQASDDLPASTPYDTYTITSGDMGRYLVLEVRGINQHGYTSSFSEVQSLATAEPQPTSSPAISGTARVGQTLTATPGTWSNLPTLFEYQWVLCDNPPASPGAVCDGQVIAGADHYRTPDAPDDTYTLTGADMQKYLQVWVYARNNVGLGSPAHSAAFSTAATLVPSNTSRPTLTGSALPGKTLTASPGSWSGNPGRFKYAWYICGQQPNPDSTSCAGAQWVQTDVRWPNSPNGGTSDSFTVPQNTYGKFVMVVVTGINDAGESDPVGVAAAVRPPVPSNTSRPTLHGSAVPGGTLTASPGSWSGNPSSFTYAWFICQNPPIDRGTTCPGARWVQTDTRWPNSPNGGTSDLFTVPQDTYGSFVMVLVTGTNDAGTSGRVVGSPVTLVDDNRGTLQSSVNEGGKVLQQIGGGTITIGGGVGHLPIPIIDPGTIGLVGGGVLSPGNGSLISDKGLGVIAAGGGNVIAAGGGNLLPSSPTFNGGTVIAAGGGNIISKGGGSALPKDLAAAGRAVAAHYAAMAGHKTPKLTALFSGAHVYQHAGRARLGFHLTRIGKRVFGALHRKAVKARRHHRKVKPVKIAVISYVGPPSGHNNVIVAQAKVFKLKF